MKIAIQTLLMCMISFCSWAYSGALTQSDMDRVKTLKRLLQEVDAKTFDQTITDIEKNPYPRVQVHIKEAIAKAYVEIVEEQGVKGKKKKEWLYSMVVLNMAYLQFAGNEKSPEGTPPLHKLIRGKLRKHLSDDIWEHPGFKQSLG